MRAMFMTDNVRNVKIMPLITNPNLTYDQTSRMPEFSGKQNPGTENFQTERSRTGKFWDQKIPGIPFFPGIREIFF